MIQKIKEAIFSYDEDQTVAVAQEVIDKGLNLLDAIEQGFAPAIREVGTKFEEMEIFLPQLVTAADNMTKAVELLNKALESQGQERVRKGIAVIGTVEGDIHDIGKTIVIALLRAAGYEVHDLGKDVPIPNFIDAAKQHKAEYEALLQKLREKGEPEGD